MLNRSKVARKLRDTAHARLNGRRMPLHAETVLYIIKSYQDEQHKATHGHAH